MKIIIYTAVCGEQDELVDPEVVFENISYIAFVDKQYDCKVWKQILIQEFSTDSVFKDRRNAKAYKVLSHLFLPDHDYSIWVDSTHELIYDPYEICGMFKGDISLFNHDRDCLYREAYLVKRDGLDWPDNTDRQIEFYKKEKMPESYKLYELVAFLRKKSPIIGKLNMMWWEQICKYSSRDQISLPYCLWKLDIIPEILPGNVFRSENSFFKKKRNHLSRIKI